MAQVSKIIWIQKLSLLDISMPLLNLNLFSVSTLNSLAILGGPSPPTYPFIKKSTFEKKYTLFTLGFSLKKYN